MADDKKSPLEYSRIIAPHKHGSIDAMILIVARLIGRQMAREEFERLSAINDNRMPED